MIILKNKNYSYKPDLFLIYNDNITYRARNKLTNNIFSLEQAPQEAPAAPVPEVEQENVGYVSISVFTASGALPVQGALVTIYIFDESGQENEIVHQTSDANGQVPLITLPVIYDRFNPFESSKYYFGTYNLRVQAINYYTVNIMDFRVFPNETTYFEIDLIPAAVAPTQGPEMTFVIPPSPIDISND